MMSMMSWQIFMQNVLDDYMYQGWHMDDLCEEYEDLLGI